MVDSEQHSPSDLQSLKEWIAEQNALSSIDTVYLLLVPITTFSLSQLLAVKDLNVGTLLLLFFPGGLISLPFGLYGRMIDSVRSRIYAWSIYILISATIFGMALLSRLTMLMLPSIIDLPPEPLSSTFANLGYFSFVLGITAAWLKWIVHIFLIRVPSRKSEIKEALNNRFFRIPVIRFLLPRMEMSYWDNVYLSIVGLALYIIFLSVSWLGIIGLPDP